VTTPSKTWNWSWDKGLVLMLALTAASAFLVTPLLITPYPAQAPWFESTAFFPRCALAIAFVAGIFELHQRRHTVELTESEELDSSHANMPLAITMLVYFGLYMLAVPWMGYLCSTGLFLMASGVRLGLGKRITLSISIVFSITLWLVFVKVLKVYFGQGWLI